MIDADALGDAKCRLPREKSRDKRPEDIEAERSAYAPADGNALSWTFHMSAGRQRRITCRCGQPKGEGELQVVTRRKP